MKAALSNQNPEVIKTLIDKGAYVNARTERGETSLMMAAFSNQNPEVITALINKGADVNARTDRGKTALMYALKYQDIKIAKTLIDKGAEIKDGVILLDLLDENQNIERNQDYWDLRDRIYNEMNN